MTLAHWAIAALAYRLIGPLLAALVLFVALYAVGAPSLECWVRDAGVRALCLGVELASLRPSCPSSGSCRAAVLLPCFGSSARAPFAGLLRGSGCGGSALMARVVSKQVK